MSSPVFDWPRSGGSRRFPAGYAGRRTVRFDSVVGYGVKDATIEYSVDGANWTSLGTTHELARGIGVAGYASNTTVDLGGAAAKYVRITANSNWGGLVKQYGLSEAYHTFMPSGTHTLEFAANGYFPPYRTVEVVPGGAHVVDVAMIPSAGNINDDNHVTMVDLAILATCWRQGADGACSDADLTHDRIIDFSDFKILADAWLRR